MEQKNTTLRHDELLRLFTHEYEKYVSHMDEGCREQLYQVAPMVFAKWYHTALAADTILSPVNIISQDLGFDEGEAAYVLDISPEKEGKEKYSFRLLTYTLERHPLLADLALVLDHCLPDCTVDENGFFPEEERAALLARLSFADAFYLDYLTQLCRQLRLLEPVTAIHVHKVRKSPKAVEFLSLPPIEQLELLKEEACYLAAGRFRYTMDLEADTIDSGFFLACLEGHQEVDEIFVRFYKRVDVDISDLWQTPPSHLTEEDHAILSSLLFAGIMLDKWFLTPMSVFFRLIRPISFTPFRFYLTVNHLAALFLMGHNISPELFLPPSYYSLTSLGKALAENKEPKEEDRQKMPHALNYDQILDAVASEWEMRIYEELLRVEVAPELYVFRVCVAEDETLWKDIEIETHSHLHEFCCDLCAAFGMDAVSDYLLSVPDQNGFPVEYAPMGSKSALNKTNRLTLEELPIQIDTALRLVPEKNKKLALRILPLEKKRGSGYLQYPRVRAQSKKITRQEQIDEIY
ncbi:hypothetical protein H9X85_03445 [Anaerotignum lactatifermentans]|uniref:Helicase XPB/Ssl2 N-terminal domain-containing protein n=1 Tax=Anaerotignum lactatifermentans TaxID=160404 RepID=A0ABS2GD49_9FIRM|nr:hypothetical protein [Anaerotignum lactatifermentans]MBM6828685.1 hypothetical protein [Anaerotignum lactatifermentans]MBM6878792.1 hypothetical protein [Anaerotignum lactatifermentans]MBM6950267.1 hypothetical protein [Anaerotignum lactatifermentans]